MILIIRQFDQLCLPPILRLLLPILKVEKVLHIVRNRMSEDKILLKVVGEPLDWFFKTVLKDHYNKRRQTLSDSNKKAILAIDYILKSCIGEGSQYPPESAAQWNSYSTSLQSGTSKVFKQILLIYLQLDIREYMAQKESSVRTRTKDKLELASLECAANELQSLPYAFNFPVSTEHLGKGLWGVDNEHTDLVVSSLSNPSIVLANYFELPKTVTGIIVESLVLSHRPRLALFLGRVHRPENWDDHYDAIYAFLLVSSGQLTEALRYERLFTENKNYQDILQNFFQLCTEWNQLKLVNCLNLSAEEEEVLNQHLISLSRPVTPSGKQSESRSSRSKPRIRSIQKVQRIPSFTDSPARNTRSANRRKTTR